MATNTAPRERRLVLRLLAYWRDLAPEGQLPAAHCIQPADIADMWPACFTLDLGGPKPIFAYVGGLHVAHHGRDLTGRPAEEAGTDTLLGHAVEYFEEVLSRKIPITYGERSPVGTASPLPIAVSCFPCPTTAKRSPAFLAAPTAASRNSNKPASVNQGMHRGQADGL